MERRKEKRAGVGGMSLRASLILLVLGCWVLPMVLTVGISGYNSIKGTRDRVSDIVTASIENTMDLMRRDLDGAANKLLSISYVPTIRNAWQSYQSTGNSAALLNTTRAFLTQNFYRDQTTQAVYVAFPSVGQASLAYNQERYSHSQAARFYGTALYASAEALMETLGTDLEFYYEDGRLYLARLLSLQDDQFKPYAVLFADIDLQNLCHGLENLPWLTGAAIRLNGVDLPVQEGDVAPPPAGESFDRLMDGGTRLMVQRSIPEGRYNFGYTVVANLEPLIQEMGAPLGVVLWVALFSAGLITVMLVFFTRRVSRPIGILSRFAGKIEQGEIGAQTDTARLGSREFTYLGTQMNAMSARLQYQFERLYREELALRDAKMKALQSQINPHFLGNTLETINWEARLAGNAKVSRMLEALSTMMEAGLDRRHRPLVHLSEEMNYINAYLYIVGERLGKRLTVEKQIDESLLDWYVPRLILQPIVENAIEHGVAGHQQGHIVIRAVAQSEEWMRLEVENDSPMAKKDEQRVKELLEREQDIPGESSANIGIRNVHQRLRLIYGPQSGLTVENTKKGSTVSSMCIQKRAKPQIESS